MYLYYTRDHFSGKRAVSSITINGTKSGAINCYYKNGNLHETEISLNRGVSGTDYVYMHISTVTKVNRPNPEPTANSGLTYNGSPQKLIPSNYDSNNSGDVYFRLGTTGSYTDNVNSITATNAGTYTIYYYSAESYYGNSSEAYAHTMTATIAKAANSGAYVTCSNYLEGTAPVPELKGTNLSSGTITYKYSTSQNGTYTTTVPTAPGTYWVKATIAGDSNYNEYTTAATSFTIIKDWSLHNSGDSEADAYIINSTEQLDLLASRVNSGNSYANKYFKLGASLSYTKATANNFTPIGTESHPFSGTFDGSYNGDAHTISGINISLGSTQDVGLFGNADGATIKNLTLTNSTITGNSYVGAILGCGSDNTPTIENCLVTNGVDVSGQSTAVGGIVGGFATIRGCVSAATVSSNGSVGGIIGNGNLSTVTNSLYTGSSITGMNRGAIVGYKGNATLNYNYYTVATIGGLGNNGADDNGARKAVVINKASGVTITPTGTATTYNVSGITAYEGNSGIKYTIGNSTVIYAGATEKVKLDITYNIEGFSVTGYNDGNGTALPPVSGNTYTLTLTANAPTVTPVGSDLWGVTTAGRDGSTAAKAYRITTPEGLNLLAKKVNGTDGYSANTYSGKYFELGDDIDYSTVALTLDGGKGNYTAIGTFKSNSDNHPFSGIFDGKGKTVSGIRIYKVGNLIADSYQGLFGYIGGGTVKNLTLTNSTITAYNRTGGIVGYDSGSHIENCHVTNNVTISGDQTIGGIAGYNSGYIRGCTCAATVSGTDYVGGIVGLIKNATISNNLALNATVSGTSYVGAIAGDTNNTTLTTNLYIGSAVGGVNGTNIYGLATEANEVTISIDEANIAMGNVVTTYGTGDYTGITAYEKGLYYKGKLYYYSDFWLGTGTAEDPYIITTTEGLDRLASDVNAGTNYDGKYFALGHNITYDGTENNYTPIGNYDHEFCGNLDGRGHTISGINVNLPNKYYVGLFGDSEAGTIKNLTVANSTFTGKFYVAAIAASGNPAASVENCVVTSDVTVSGDDTVAGIVGESIIVNGCISAATVSGTSYVGGIIGDTGYGSVRNCLYIGNSISGNYKVGAIAGQKYSSNVTIENNYHTVYGLSGIGYNGSATDGARFAVSNTTKPDEATIGTAGTAYAADETYEGITPYTNGLYYNGRYYWHEELSSFELDNSASNSEIISDNNGNRFNVILTGRTLYKDGKWNTLCLPFDLELSGSPLAGDNVVAKVLNTSSKHDNGTLTLNFSNAPDVILAGTPFIIKWDNTGVNLTENELVFTDVTISDANRDVAFTGGTFKGNYAPLEITDDNRNSIVLLAAGNKLGYATTDRTIANGKALGAFRAYFDIPSSMPAREFVVNFGDDESTTGIISTTDFTDYTDKAGVIYDLQGRRVENPKKGLYIVNGKKVVLH